jgi:phospholipase C
MHMRNSVKFTCLLVICILSFSSFNLATAANQANSTGKITHIVIITQENHSFDNYFGTFPGLASRYRLNLSTCVPVNPNEKSLGCVRPFNGDNNSAFIQTQGLSHSWNSSHIDYNSGTMNGFIYANTLLSAGKLAHANYTMAYYTNYTIPNYWDYASEYALDANFFSSQLSYTYPNRLYDVAARSNENLTKNIAVDLPLYNLNYSTIISQLSNRAISWDYYTGNWQDNWDCKPFNGSLIKSNGTYKGFDSYYGVLEDFPNIQLNMTMVNGKPVCDHLLNDNDLLKAIKTNTLPDVVWVNPNTTDSEHPGNTAPLPTGQMYVTSIVNAIMQNAKLWSTTAIFITDDEFGGYYDGVSPPQVDQYGYGFRVPLIIISPYVKHGIYYGKPYGAGEDFSAFLSTIESNWNLQNLTNRDGVDAPLWYMFNFKQAPLPPLLLPSNALAVYPVSSCLNSGLCRQGPNQSPVYLANPPVYPQPSGNSDTWDDPGD